MRRLLILLVPLALVAASCGDDDAADTADGPTTTVDDGGDREGDSGDEGGDDEGGDHEGAPSGSAPDSTVAADAPAEDAPGDAVDETDGIDDPGVLLADLAGAEEVPGPGDRGASGRFEAELIEGALCIDMAAEGLDSEVAAAHVHEGAAGTAGDPVLDIGAPTASDGATDAWSDVCVPVDGALVERMATEPDQFHVNVHSASFPDGAVRGQLALGSIFDRQLS